MPPTKRATAATPGQTKKSKSSAENTDTVPRSNRWAPVSVSANADTAYREFIKNPLQAYKYVLLCQLPFSSGDDDDEDEEDEEDDDASTNGQDKSAGEEKVQCDGGKTCLCDKPASEHPNHPWKLTNAGKRKFFLLRTFCDVRNPDIFGMYTFNDHVPYGITEVVQNLFLDFEEAAGNYKEQWSICEALGFFLPSDADDMTMADDGDMVDATCQLAGRMFLSMLATLESKDLLSPDSEVENLGLIMGLFAKSPSGLRECGLLEESKSEPLGPKKDKKKWSPHSFEEQILAYARKYKIKLEGPGGVSELADEIDGNADLPDPTAAGADPFGWAKALKSYKSKHGGVGEFLSRRSLKGTTPIGGDYLDVTTWTPQQRKSYAFKNKDPFSKKELDAIKAGGIIGRG